MFNHKIASLEARIARLEAHLSRKASIVSDPYGTDFPPQKKPSLFTLTFYKNLKKVQRISVNAHEDFWEIADIEIRTASGLMGNIALIPQGDTVVVSVRGDYRRVMKNEFDNTIGGATQAAQWVASYFGQEPK